jgi:hypothetical protein
MNNEDSNNPGSEVDIDDINNLNVSHSGNSADTRKH